MAEPKPLRYPKKSHRKQIKTPVESPDLAEFMGTVFGDGGFGNDWQLVISLDPTSDADYAKYVSQQIRKLFELETAQRIRPHINTLVLVCSSTNLVDFLVRKGVPRGNKIKQQISTPTWIGRSPEYERAFVRGLMDTDGCLFIHRHVTKGSRCHNIGLCFTSWSKRLIASVADIFRRNGMKPHITDKGRRIYFYSLKDVNTYVKTISSSNPRILNKYKEWLDLQTAIGREIGSFIPLKRV